MSATCRCSTRIYLVCAFQYVWTKCKKKKKSSNMQTELCATLRKRLLQSVLVHPHQFWVLWYGSFTQIERALYVLYLFLWQLESATKSIAFTCILVSILFVDKTACMCAVNAEKIQFFVFTHHQCILLDKSGAAVQSGLVSSQRQSSQQYLSNLLHIIDIIFFVLVTRQKETMLKSESENKNIFFQSVTISFATDSWTKEENHFFCFWFAFETHLHKFSYATSSQARI